jgi:hypothetical protein
MGLFSDRTLANRKLGQTVFVARYDIPWDPMLKPEKRGFAQTQIGMNPKPKWGLPDLEY